MPVVKQVEQTSDKLRVVEHLRAAAAGCDELCLWLDCDREGENIAHEVMAVTRSIFPDVASQVRRARFSSLAPAELRTAAKELPRHLPDAAVSRSVDARQELDLRAGVAFSQQLTSTCVNIARRKLGDQEGSQLRLISWGPCQSPTLWFVVQRFLQVSAFRPRPLFKVTSSVSDPSTGRMLDLRWVPPQEAQRSETEAEDRQQPQGAGAPRRREERGATFDGAAAREVLRKVQRGAQAVVSDVSLKERQMPAPAGLNTVALLQACSKAMGVSPKKAMQVAEKLYSSGFISYPRTETTKYSKGFDVAEVLEGHARHPAWGHSAERQLRQLRRGWRPPPVGRDMGDHPPITPIRPATRQDLGGGLEWRIYEFISRHFLGSLSEPLRYRSVVSKISVEGSGCHFEHSEVIVDEPGFGGAMPWVLSDLGAQRPEADHAPLARGARLRLNRVDLAESMTSPPPFMQEHELIGLMDEHGIGTDASMATHVATICDRNYVAVVDELGEPLRPPSKPGSKQQPRQRGRFLVPTTLGLAFLEAVEGVDADLVSPPIRAKMEAEVGKIADEGLDKDEVLDRNLDFFRCKFERLIKETGHIQELLKEALEPTRSHLQRLRQQGCFGDPAPPRQDGRGRGGRSASAGPSHRRSDDPSRRSGGGRDGGRPQRRPGGGAVRDGQGESRHRALSEPGRPYGRNDDWGAAERDRGGRASRWERLPPEHPSSSSFDRPRGRDDRWRGAGSDRGPRSRDDRWGGAGRDDGERRYREEAQERAMPEPPPRSGPGRRRGHEDERPPSRGFGPRGGRDDRWGGADEQRDREDARQWAPPHSQRPDPDRGRSREDEQPPGPDFRRRRSRDDRRDGAGEWSDREEGRQWERPDPPPQAHPSWSRIHEDNWSEDPEDRHKQQMQGWLMPAARRSSSGPSGRHGRGEDSSAERPRGRGDPRSARDRPQPRASSSDGPGGEQGKAQESREAPLSRADRWRQRREEERYRVDQ